jgi:hypothetical protein
MKILHFSIPVTQSARVHHPTFELSKTDTRILLDEKHNASKKKLVAHWLMDEHSQLYCQWLLKD